MIISTGSIWIIATMSDMVNSTFVFLIGSKIRGHNKKKKYIKWRGV